jgi:hypothetical protein
MRQKVAYAEIPVSLLISTLGRIAIPKAKAVGENESGKDQSTRGTTAPTSEETGTPGSPELAGRGVRSYPRTWGLTIRTEF